MSRQKLMARDLSEVNNGHNYAGINGKPMLEVAEATLKMASEQIGHWNELEPVVRSLISKVKGCVDSPDYKDDEAADLLVKCANSLKTLQNVATSFVKVSDGMTRLAFMVEGPRLEKQRPSSMTEKQMASIVVETVKKMAKDAKICPVCTRTIEVEVD